MKRFALIFPLGLGLSIGCGAAQSGQLPAEGESRFVIVREVEEVSDEAVELAKRRADESFEKLRSFLGEENTPSGPIVIHLGGFAKLPGGDYRYPHVDARGHIYLYRYNDSPMSYFSVLPHEMVHVFRGRIRGHQRWYQFFEEAFASYVSDQVEPLNRGFPLYGYSLDLVAGQWLHKAEDIPMMTLIERHRILNLPCKAQSYTLRASFFRYLDRGYGKDALLRMAYGPEPHSLELYSSVFSKDFQSLEKEWRSDLAERYRAIPQADERAHTYRTQTPVANFQICQAGTEF